MARKKRKVAKELGNEVGRNAEQLTKTSIEMVTTSLSLAREVWERAKIRALKRGITLAKLIEDALRRELGEEEKKEK
jgi:hypothetical protein